MPTPRTILTQLRAFPSPLQEALAIVALYALAAELCVALIRLARPTLAPVALTVFLIGFPSLTVTLFVLTYRRLATQFPLPSTQKGSVS